MLTLKPSPHGFATLRDAFGMPRASALTQALRLCRIDGITTMTLSIARDIRAELHPLTASLARQDSIDHLMTKHEFYREVSPLATTKQIERLVTQDEAKHFASKKDVADLKATTLEGFAALRAEMQKEFSVERGETNRRFAAGQTESKGESVALRAEMRQGFATERVETKGEFVALRTEMQAGFAAGRAETKSEFAALRAEMQAGFATERAERQRGFAAVPTHLEMNASFAKAQALTQESIAKLRNETHERINELQSYTQEGFGQVRLELQKMDKKLTLWGLGTMALYLATNGEGITHWIKMVAYAFK